MRLRVFPLLQSEVTDGDAAGATGRVNVLTAAFCFTRPALASADGAPAASAAAAAFAAGTVTAAAGAAAALARNVPFLPGLLVPGSLVADGRGEAG